MVRRVLSSNHGWEFLVLLGLIYEFYDNMCIYVADVHPSKTSYGITVV